MDNRIEEFWGSEQAKIVSQQLGEAWLSIIADLGEPPEGLKWGPVCESIEENEDGSATLTLGAELLPIDTEPTTN